jgi:hypothetical protein
MKTGTRHVAARSAAMPPPLHEAASTAPTGQPRRGWLLPKTATTSGSSIWCAPMSEVVMRSCTSPPFTRAKCARSEPSRHVAFGQRQRHGRCSSCPAGARQPSLRSASRVLCRSAPEPGDFPQRPGARKLPRSGKKGGARAAARISLVEPPSRTTRPRLTVRPPTLNFSAASAIGRPIGPPSPCRSDRTPSRNVANRAAHKPRWLAPCCACAAGSDTVTAKTIHQRAIPTYVARRAGQQLAARRPTRLLGDSSKLLTRPSAE